MRTEDIVLKMTFRLSDDEEDKQMMRRINTVMGTPRKVVSMVELQVSSHASCLLVFMMRHL